MLSKLLRYSPLLLLFTLGAVFIFSNSQPSAETVAGFQARQAFAPRPVDPIQNDGFDFQYEPISAAAVALADVVHIDTPSHYDMWMAGEIDIEEDEGRISRVEADALRAEAMDMAPDADVQHIEANGRTPTPGVAFDSIHFGECCGAGQAVPPDPQMAVGPDHIIATVNLGFEIYDKTGTSLVGPLTFDSFFAAAGVPSCDGNFDPNALYDEEEDRYFIAADSDGDSYCMAVTQTNDPTGSWYIYQVPTGGGFFFDYPHAGVGDEAIYMGANMFGGVFEGRIWAFDKSDMYAGNPMTPQTVAIPNQEGTPQPLSLNGFGDGTWPAYGETHYFVADPYDGDTMNVYVWNNSLSGGALALHNSINLEVATGVTSGFPIDVPALGGNDLQSNDWRMRQFQYRNGAGWVTDTVSCNPGGGTVNCVRWVELDMATGTVNQASVFASSDTHRIFPELAVNHEGHMVIGYTKSDASMFPGIWYTGRCVDDPAGTLQTEAELKAGETGYFAYDTPPHRWGDYTSMVPDPDGVTFWYHGEYSKSLAGTTANWGTYVGSFTMDDCDPSSVTLGNNSAETTQSSTTLILVAGVVVLLASTVAVNTFRKSQI